MISTTKHLTSTTARGRWPMLLGAGLSITLLAGPTACFEDDPDGGSLETDGQEEAGDGECAGVCVEPAPPGWSGPVASIEFPTGSTPPDGCGPSYESVLQTLNVGEPLVEDVTCECECGLPADGVCLEAIVPEFAGNGCAGGTTGELLLLADAGCADVFSSAGAGPVSYLTPDIDSGYFHSDPCQPLPSEVEIPPAQPGAQLSLCAADDSSGTCPDAGVCQPDSGTGLESRLCIIRDGDWPCPDGAYFKRQLAYGAISDDRECGDCQCDDEPEVRCEWEVSLFDNACEGDPLATIDSAQTCNVVPEAPSHMRVDSLTPVGTCGGSAGAVEGEVTLESLVTVCCAG